MKFKNNLIRKKTVSYFVLILNIAIYSPPKNCRDNSTQTNTVTFKDTESNQENNGQNILSILTKSTRFNKNQPNRRSVEDQMENSPLYKNNSTQTNIVTFKDTESNQENNNQNQKREDDSESPIRIIKSGEFKAQLNTQDNRGFNKQANNNRDTIHAQSPTQTITSIENVQGKNQPNHQQVQNPLTKKITSEEYEAKK